METSAHRFDRSDTGRVPPLRLRGEGEDRTPSPAPETSNPLSDAHFDQLRRLGVMAGPVERAGRYAGFSGWTTLLAGAFSLPLAIGDTAMLVLCLVLAGIGTRELTLRRRMIGLETRAPRLLALNQLCLGAALTGYAVYKLLSAPATGVVESAMASDPTIAGTPELRGMMSDLVELEKLATAALYVGLVGVAVIVQGGTAAYYGLKVGRLRRLHRANPEWALRVYRSVRGV